MNFHHAVRFVLPDAGFTKSLHQRVHNVVQGQNSHHQRVFVQNNGKIFTGTFKAFRCFRQRQRVGMIGGVWINLSSTSEIGCLFKTRKEYLWNQHNPVRCQYCHPTYQKFGMRVFSNDLFDLSSVSRRSKR